MIANNCHDLAKLDLEDCGLITDTTLSLLTTGCPLLETLILSLCELISDTGIRYLTNNSNASNLKILELDNCQFITDQTLEYLSQLSSLKRIEVYDCQSLSREGIKNFMVSLWNSFSGVFFRNWINSIDLMTFDHFDHLWLLWITSCDLLFSLVPKANLISFLSRNWIQSWKCTPTSPPRRRTNWTSREPPGIRAVVSSCSVLCCIILRIIFENHISHARIRMPETKKKMPKIMNRL